MESVKKYQKAIWTLVTIILLYTFVVQVAWPQYVIWDNRISLWKDRIERYEMDIRNLEEEIIVFEEQVRTLSMEYEIKRAQLAVMSEELNNRMSKFERDAKKRTRAFEAEMQNKMKLLVHEWDKAEKSIFFK